MMFRIWILEDDPANQFVYRESLSSLYDITFFDTLTTFKAAISKGKPDMLIADLRLPDESFLSYLVTHTQVFSDLPVIVVSGIDDLHVCQKCFQSGAQDFITKPFSVNELIAKIEKVKKSHFLGTLRFNDLHRCLVVSESVSVQLTPKEYQILKILSASSDMILDREQIRARVWKENELSGNVVDVHVHAIRKKIKQYGISIEFVEPSFFRILC